MTDKKSPKRLSTFPRYCEYAGERMKCNGMCMECDVFFQYEKRYKKKRDDDWMQEEIEEKEQ